MARDDASLTEYALGLLERDARDALRRELTQSAATHQELLDVENLLEEVGLTAQPRQPSPRARELLLNSLDAAGRYAGFAQRLARFLDWDMEPTRQLLTALETAPAAPWVSALPGLHHLFVTGGPRLAGAQCALVWLEPGRTFPPHRHLGDEWGLVLGGQAEEDSGRIYLAGDLVHNAPASVHSFWTVGDEPFVFAVALFGEIEWGFSLKSRFNSILLWLMTRFR